MNHFARLILVLVSTTTIACGSGDSESEIGGPEKLHHGIESLLARGLENEPGALSVAEAESIRQEVQPISSQQTLVSKAANDDQLLAHFSFYPAHTLSSRILGTSFLEPRDRCLERCYESSRCGAVTYFAEGEICYYHGPTLDIDKLVPTTVNSKKGATTLDTYLISARNQEYREDGTIFWIFRVSNGNGTFGSPKMKILYSDGTASTWHSLGSMPGADQYGDLEESDYRGTFTAPNRAIEAAIVALDGSDSVGLGTVTFAGIDCQYCSDPGIHDPWGSWLFLNNTAPGHEPVRLAGDCDDNVLDGCAPMVAVPVNSTEEGPNFDPYDDAAYISLKDLQADTNKYVW